MPKKNPQSSTWSKEKRIFFRFSFVFILLFIFVKNNSTFFFLSWINLPITKLMQSITPWFAKNILHYEYDYTIFTNGSGDTSYDWINLLLLFFIALFTTVIWSVFDKRKQYNTLYYWLTVVIRYYIAFMLVNYGIIKLLHAQMSPPSLHRLMQPLGEFSPMGLAWTYLGFSKGYNIFMGIVEILSALLLFRRTMVLGALITAATATNIMTVNYFYDVPVKMLSTALLLLSLFLLLPYFRSFYLFFLQEKISKIKSIQRPTYRKRWVQISLTVLKYGILALVLRSQYHHGMATLQYIQQHQKSIIHGIYKVPKENGLFPGDWRYIIFEYENTASIRDDWYALRSIATTINGLTSEVTINHYTFRYRKMENGDLFLERNQGDQRHRIKLSRVEDKDMELIKRPYNWTQEYPYNR